MRMRPILAWNWTIDRSSQATTHASARRASTTGSANPRARNKQSGRRGRRGLLIHEIGDLLRFPIYNRRPHMVRRLLVRGGAGKTEPRIEAVGPASRNNWRMPLRDELPPAHLSLAARTWMFVLRAYLIVAGGLVLVRIAALAVGYN